MWAKGISAEMERRKFSLSHSTGKSCTIGKKISQGKEYQRRANLFLYWPTFHISWLKIYTLFSSLHCFKHYIKESFMWKLPKTCTLWMFERWTKCSAAPHPLTICSRFKNTNALPFSLLNNCFSDCSLCLCISAFRIAGVPQVNWVGSLLFICGSSFSSLITFCSTLWIFLVGSLSHSAFCWSLQLFAVNFLWVAA